MRANPVAMRPSSGTPAAKPMAPDDGEHEADQLRELQRRHRFLLGDRPEPRSDEALENQAVGMLPRPAPGADREHDGLHAEDHGRRCGS